MDHKHSAEDSEMFISPTNKKCLKTFGGPLLSNNSPGRGLDESSPKRCYDGTHRDLGVEKHTPFRTPLQSLSSSDSENLEQSAHWNTPVDKSRFTPLSSGRKPFLQQRVERLYSPGALAQGFFRRSRELSKLQESDEMEKVSTQPLACLKNLRSRCVSFGNENEEINGSIISPRKLDLEPSESSQDVLLAAAEVVLPTEVADCTGSPLPAVLPTVSVQEYESETQDGHYFLKVLKQEMDRLENLASGVELELASGDSLPDEVKGMLRVAACKARLLMKQKMQQFHGLCQKNILQNLKSDDEFPTTNNDLAGFWAMVKLQVDDVDQMFEELSRLRKNNWEQKAEVAAVVVSKRRSPKPGTSKPAMTEKQIAIRDATRKAREELRRKIMQERRKLQNVQ